MLKSFLIKLRKKPKIVRDQAALVFAGVFTFLVFGIWAVSLPGNFTGLGDGQSAEVFSGLKETVVKDAPNFENITNELKDLTTSSSSSSSNTNSPVVPNEYPANETGTSAVNERSIRIATTSDSQSGTSSVEQ